MLNQRWPKHAKIPNFSVLTFPPLWDQQLPKRKDVWSEVSQFWPLWSDHTKFWKMLWFYCFLKGELPHCDPSNTTRLFYLLSTFKKRLINPSHTWNVQQNTLHLQLETHLKSNLQLSALPVWSAFFHNPITPSWLYVGGYYAVAQQIHFTLISSKWMKPDTWDGVI